MTIASDLLVILAFLSTLYTLLGLLCAIAERVQAVLARPWPQRRASLPVGRSVGQCRRFLSS